MASSLSIRRPVFSEESEMPGRPPNFVILLCDDLGYGDLGCYGNRVIRTPHVDGLAADGARLTQFYATPTCTPSRAALLTGRYPVRSGLTRVLIPGEHFGIPASEITMAEALKQRGYRTACIGKWHLGNKPPYRPNLHGFDYFYGLHYSNDMTLPLIHWPTLRLFRNQNVIEAPVQQSTLTERFTGEAVRFIQTNREDRFLLYLAYTMPHLPWSTSARFAGTSRYGAYGDAVEEIDWSVGEIVRTLSRNGLEKNTLVFFLSDNGPEPVTPGPGGSAGPLRGGKGSTWEGGVRVPCIARWPDRIPAGSVRPGIACLMDLYATILEWADADVPAEYIVDGRSLIPYLQGESESPRDTYCYYHRKKLFAVRSGEWKLHFNKLQAGKKGAYIDPVACRPPELYNLDQDPGETRDCHRDHPGVVARLTRLAGEFESSFAPGRRSPPRWRSVLPRIRSKRNRGR
jgi:arylsulfatase A-like enzyme